MSYAVVQSEVVARLQPVSVPFEAATQAHLYVGAVQFFLAQAVICISGDALRNKPVACPLAQRQLHIVCFRQPDMQLRTGVEEHVELLPKRNGVETAHGNGQVVLQDAVLYVFRLCGRCVYGTPVLLVSAVGYRIEHARLHAEVERQQEREGSTDTHAVQVHIRIGIVVGPLLRLGITNLQAVLHAEMIVCFLSFLRGVEECVVRCLQVGLALQVKFLRACRTRPHTQYNI